MESNMIGMMLLHPAAKVCGTVSAVSVDAAGNALCRIEDHWFFADECVSV